MPSHPNIVLMLSYTATIMNLFNLIPIRPLDGGRVTQIVGSWFKYVGIACLLIMSFFIREPVMFFIWVIVLGEINIDKTLRLGLGLACELAMIIFICLGYSHQLYWINIIDITLVSAINFTYFITMYGERKQNRELKTLFDTLSPDLKEKLLPRLVASNKEEVIPKQTRLKWLAYYMALSGALILLFIYQVPFIPKH